MRTLNIATPTHGRILIEDAAVSASGPLRLLVGCHGYGQAADTMMEQLRRIPGAEAWRLVSVQALHRFYTRDNQSVIASWMTRQDRDEAIADNIEYMNRAVEAASTDAASGAATSIVFLGFSQGASMAVRGAARSRVPAAGLILLGGDIPPDVKDDDAARLPPILIGVGSHDTWYNGARADADVAWLERRGIRHEVARFEGGHEFTDAFRTAAGRWLANLVG